LIAVGLTKTEEHNDVMGGGALPYLIVYDVLLSFEFLYHSHMEKKSNTLSTFFFNF